ncbi:MAG: glycoside hydrolase family 99-like domain-containing protein [Clostridia bacterium]|nr:glycoside hydrolase family 99-like domain-containing protein [Clostridia bacterium]
MQKYDIAAYVWPAYTGDEPRSRIFWPEGIGEWQTVKNSAPKDNGYHWDRKPLWGYVNEADPQVMSEQIEAAVSHGVNVFIYDWYWYDDRPFLENSLNDGFLKAPNNNKMKFYIMWANHNATHLWDIRLSDTVNSTIWQGAVTRKQFETIGKRWINQYFKRENYYKIDSKPVVSIYDVNNLINGLGGIDETADALKWLDQEAKNEGLGGVHIQFVRWSGKIKNYSGVDGTPIENEAALVDTLGFNSVTNYQFVHMTDVNRDYLEILEDIKTLWHEINGEYTVPYYPNVSVGWDNNPRFKKYITPIATNNTPENFKKCLLAVKEYCDKTDTRLITVNSWNEWTETSYLEPDNLYGYGYLEAIKEVFGE